MTSSNILETLGISKIVDGENNILKTGKKETNFSKVIDNLNEDDEKKVTMDRVVHTEKNEKSENNNIEMELDLVAGLNEPANKLMDIDEQKISVENKVDEMNIINSNIDNIDDIDDIDDIDEIADIDNVDNAEEDDAFVLKNEEHYSNWRTLLNSTTNSDPVDRLPKVKSDVKVQSTNNDKNNPDNTSNTTKNKDQSLNLKIVLERLTKGNQKKLSTNVNEVQENNKKLNFKNKKNEKKKNDKTTKKHLDVENLNLKNDGYNKKLTIKKESLKVTNKIKNYHSSQLGVTKTDLSDYSNYQKKTIKEVSRESDVKFASTIKSSNNIDKNITFNSATSFSKTSLTVQNESNNVNNFDTSNNSFEILDLNKNRWLERLAKLIETGITNSKNMLEIKLEPKKLGKIILGFNMNGDNADILLRAESNLALQAIAESHSSLQRMLSHQGINLNDFSLSQEGKNFKNSEQEKDNRKDIFDKSKEDNDDRNHNNLSLQENAANLIINIRA